MEVFAGTGTTGFAEITVFVNMEAVFSWRKSSELCLDDDRTGGCIAKYYLTVDGIVGEDRDCLHPFYSVGG